MTSLSPRHTVSTWCGDVPLALNRDTPTPYFSILFHCGKPEDNWLLFLGHSQKLLRQTFPSVISKLKKNQKNCISKEGVGVSLFPHLSEGVQQVVDGDPAVSPLLLSCKDSSPFESHGVFLHSFSDFGQDLICC